MTLVLGQDELRLDHTGGDLDSAVDLSGLGPATHEGEWCLLASKPSGSSMTRASRALRSFHRWTRSTVHDRGVNLSLHDVAHPCFCTQFAEDVSARWRYSIRRCLSGVASQFGQQLTNLHAQVVRLCNDEGLAVLFSGLLDAPTVFVYLSGGC